MHHRFEAAAPLSSGLAAEIGKRQPFAVPEQEAFLNIIRTHEALAEEFDRLFKASGLTSAQYNALRILRGAGGRLQTYQIADNMISRQPDITRLITRLEESGLVNRDPCETDRRVVWVEITPRGSRILKKLDEPIVTLHKRQLGHLGERKLAQLNSLLFEARHPFDSDRLP